MDQETIDSTSADVTSDANQSLQQQEILAFYYKLLSLTGQSVDTIKEAVQDALQNYDLADIDLAQIEELLTEMELISDLPLSLKDKEKRLKKINEKRNKEEKDSKASNRKKRSKKPKKAPVKAGDEAKDPAAIRRRQLAKILQQQLLLRDPNTLKSMQSILKNQKIGFNKLSPDQKMQLLQDFVEMPNDAFIQQAKQVNKTMIKQNTAAADNTNQAAAPLNQADASLASNANDPNNVMNLKQAAEVLFREEVAEDRVEDSEKNNNIEVEVDKEMEEEQYEKLSNYMNEMLGQAYIETQVTTQMPMTNDASTGNTADNTFSSFRPR